MVRAGFRVGALTMALVACGGGPASTQSTAASGATAVQGAESAGGLEAQVVLEHPEVTGDGDPSTDETARMNGTIRLRNRGTAPITVTDSVQLASSLEWEIRDDHGARWQVTFLPPPTPPPGGIPTHSVTLAPGAEADWGWTGQVSGYYRQGASPGGGRLPAGRYRLTVGGIAVGMGTTVLRAQRVTFTVRERR